MKKEKLAIFGGPKSFNIQLKHITQLVKKS